MKNNFIDKTQKILYLIIAVCAILSIVSGLYVARALEPYKMRIQFLEQEIRNNKQITGITCSNIAEDIKEINKKLETITTYIINN